MRVGIIQPNYLPWRGYFDFIASVDAFVFLDDVQYTKNDWRNRNRIKTPQGAQWITVPVLQPRLDQLISETRIDTRYSWLRKHLGALQANYARAPYLQDALDLLHGADEHDNIAGLDIDLTRRVCGYLGIATRLISARELTAPGNKTEKLMYILRQLGATAYLSGESADAYLDKEAFRRAGIGLEYKRYDYAPYPQLWGEFDGALSILDLIANCGPASSKYLRSHARDKLIVSNAS